MDELTERIGILLVGSDASRWDLRRGDPRLTDGGIDGLGRFDTEVFSQESSFTDGAEYLGWRAKARAVSLPLLAGVTAETPLQWQMIDDAFARALRPGAEQQLVVTRPDNHVRTLTMRFERDEATTYTVDPSLDCFDVLAPRFTAHDPWWYGQEQLFTFERPSSRGFFPGPPFYIAPSANLGRELVSNPGDDDLWPHWEQDGPYDSFLFEVAGRTVASTTPVPEGQTLIVETDPRRRGAYLVDTEQHLAGQNPPRMLADNFLSQYRFGRVAPGQAIPLTVIVQGAGQTRLSLHPRYFKAW